MNNNPMPIAVVVSRGGGQGGFQFAFGPGPGVEPPDQITVSGSEPVTLEFNAVAGNGVQAVSFLDDAKHSGDLHRAACNFKRRPGQVYHLYRKAADATLYWSMLSPEEWGTPPDTFEGSYRLELDMSWTPVEDTEQRDTIEEPLRKLLGQ